MFIASQKKRENIAEYLLYMWQIEDLIRAYELDIDRIDREIVHKHTGLDENQQQELRDWYESLIDMMRREGVQQKGHLQLNINTLNDLWDLHRRLMADPRYASYANEYYKVLPYIVELRAKAGEEKPDELEAIFNMLYGVLLLRMQGKKITPQTQAALKDVSHYLGMLSAYYKKDYNNELFNEEEPSTSF